MAAATPIVAARFEGVMNDDIVDVTRHVRIDCRPRTCRDVLGSEKWLQDKRDVEGKPDLAAYDTAKIKSKSCFT